MNRQVAIVAHGGAGAQKSFEDGCELAARTGLDRLRHGSPALDAAVEAVVMLENDERFNAGNGSVLGLDGATIEMDAGVMDSQGRLGAVAALREVRNPVRVARQVCDTPHHLLCGEGALRFARQMGHGHYKHISTRAHTQHEELIRKMMRGEWALPWVDNALFARFWNYERVAPPRMRAACDTVGVVCRDGEGHFAVAGSTGGSAPALLGRVGDTPIVGSGFYAGPAGAVAATGIGEHIIRHLLAHTVYQWLAEGMALERALRRGIELFPTEVDVGLIAITRSEAGCDSNRDMPWSRLSAPLED
jgi:L-asparaginase / beta-aspartyl-peptidase